MTMDRKSVCGRVNEKECEQQLHMKVKYLTGDETRALFFVTYQLLPQEGENA